ncbi:acyl-CoA dehydrogenase family protein [Smaragdicoccus niigatensis]|uniref:acyl-CoA dehydrogenase family protein n=1 Tax=Smaragdicoccus niigatensis TaxID=359359 RepID=UPI000367019C|nr:acyl-CoA dehydrogenase family protein [Smaragdicoccus niigatensis]
MTADVFRFLLTAEIPAPATSIDDWWTATRSVAAAFEDTVDIAAAGGFAAGSVAHAFGAGYNAALRALIPDLAGHLAAMCVTEAGGGHPRAIQTTLEKGVVNGTKTFVTMGSAATELLVVAKEGTSGDGRPVLKLVRVNAEQDGVTVTDRPPLPIVPELPHSEVTLENVQVAEVYDGDGYLQYVKPFRTVEDIHVSAATVGWMIRVARESPWPPDVIESLLASFAALRTLGAADPSSPTVHIALAGVMAQMTDGLAKLDALWNSADLETAAMWSRDKAILQVANRVRAARLETAWEAVARK